MSHSTRHFLFLQGPHGPFFGQLGAALQADGHAVFKVGFNRGDRFFWPRRLPYTPYRGDESGWAKALERLIKVNAITDIVIYGDARPLHAAAVTAAKAHGLKLHCFEEGYLRPFWATYERNGANGNSPLMALGIEKMRDILGDDAPRLAKTPAQWGPLWHHIFYGAVFHLNLLFPSKTYARYQPHRVVSVRQEFLAGLRAMATLPLHSINRRLATQRLFKRKDPYFLGLLQLGHDSSILSHSAFDTNKQFVDLCIKEFSRGASAPLRLVFKTHPLDDGRDKLDRHIRTTATRHNVADRVDFIQGGKLGALLDRATGAITINSTAAQQALWRGLPVRATGNSVFKKGQLVSRQPLAEFFKSPTPPDRESYLVYRAFLLQTSQVPGGYYTNEGRMALISRVVNMMLAEEDPYSSFIHRHVAKTTQK
ncbi:MAG: capsule biosynthesis protein CapA [Rhodobacteraceae bacterium]|nr:capsule biosynthesis protein CapA [Paracoccaceae bacterium]